MARGASAYAQFETAGVTRDICVPSADIRVGYARQPKDAAHKRYADRIKARHPPRRPAAGSDHAALHDGRRRKLSAMPRHRFDPLARRDLPHWITVAGMDGATISCKPVTFGVDLHDVMAAAIARLTGEGWQAESDGRHVFLFINRGGERSLVNLTPVDPGQPPGAGHAYLAGVGSAALPAVQ